MGAGHGHTLYVHEHSPIHRLAPAAKIVAAVSWVFCVALTPREAVWAFAIYAIGVAVLVRASRVSYAFVARRLLVIVPFVLFAVFIPLIATGEQVEVGPLSLSVEGLWGAWNILAKATLGASISILLTATTELADLIRGLGRLRVPAVLVSIAMFMVRYLELIADELRRTRVAMTSRGYDPRWLAQTGPIASSAGALFVRSYERGERVHDAMVARGFTGTMPTLTQPQTGRWDWTLVGLFVAMWVGVVVAAFLT